MIGSQENYWETTLTLDINLLIPESVEEVSHKPDYLYICLDLPNNNDKKFYYQIVCVQHNESVDDSVDVREMLKNRLSMDQGRLYGDTTQQPIQHGPTGFDTSPIHPSLYAEYSLSGTSNYWGFKTDAPN